jgi:adenine-specific DNA methylase
MADGGNVTRKRLLIEDWLPAAAIGVECIRERSTGQQPPDKRFHVWWARRPLAASRAAVLASVLPADFPRASFERLLGFGRPGSELVAIRQLMDTGMRVEGGFGVPRSFKAALSEQDLARAHAAARQLWGRLPTVMDPMAGGGSIPLESMRLGFPTLANEYNPVACSVLEATLDYPIRFGRKAAERARHWGRVWEQAVTEHLKRFFPKEPDGSSVHAYIFARTVPCPGTGHATPLVSDWHLLKPKSGAASVVAVPVVDRVAGTWTVEIREVGAGRGRVAAAPAATYRNGGGTSLFAPEALTSEWIKAKAQAGEMGSALYAVALKTPQGLKFRPPQPADLEALAAAEAQLAQRRGDWEARNLIPTEEYPQITTDPRPRVYGMPRWADMFSPRQLLGFGVLMEQLQVLRPKIVAAEGEDLGEAVMHLLAFTLDKLANWNAILSSWNVQAQTLRSVFDRHDFSFKTTFAEMAPCVAGGGLAWALDSCISAYAEMAALPRAAEVNIPELTHGSAASLVQIGDSAIDAVVVDPPYSDNVQYSELADFFYVWLKRTQGPRHPDWFSTLLSENDQEAVKNDARHRAAAGSAKGAKTAAQAHYERLMLDVFRECHRVLRADGVLTVMFTHKKQEAWEALFTGLIDAEFTITATWPIVTEGWHSLHQAKKNAAQSTVILVARKRPSGAGTGYFDAAMKREIEDRARSSAERLAGDGLNAVDQLVGSFGPAMEVFSRYDRVWTDTGEPVLVGRAIDIAADAVADWRIHRLAAQGLEGVEAEARFALLCWDVLGAEEFRFNEAKLLGNAVGMDPTALQQAGLIAVAADKVKLLSVQERRRDRPLTQEQAVETLFGWQPEVPAAGRRRARRADVLKIHPNDPHFRTSLDLVHALALAHHDAGGGAAGIGAARAIGRQQAAQPGDAVARLMEALVRAAPEAMRRERGPKSAAARFPEFRAWHALLQPLFGITPPDWSEKRPDPTLLDRLEHAPGGDDTDEDETGTGEEDEADAAEDEGGEEE